MSPNEFLKLYEAATCAHDLEGTLSLIADDAIYLFSDQTSHIGKPAIRKVLVSNFANISHETYRLEKMRWIASADNFAGCVYEFKWSGVVDGPPAYGNGRGTSVIKKVDGRWLVAHEHLSSGKV